MLRKSDAAKLRVTPEHVSLGLSVSLSARLAQQHAETVGGYVSTQIDAPADDRSHPGIEIVLKPLVGPVNLLLVCHHLSVGNAVGL